MLTGYSPEATMNMRGGPLTLPLRFPKTFDEEWLDRVKRICIGADGSVIQAGDIVYVLSIPDKTNRVLSIDYFHGYYEELYGVAAVLVERPYHDDRIHIARNMIATGRSRIGAPRLRGYGFVVRRIIAIQRCFRERRRKRLLQEELGRNVRRRVDDQQQELARNARRDDLRKQDEQQMVCPSCQATPLSKATFCHRCGVRLRASASTRDRQDQTAIRQGRLGRNVRRRVEDQQQQLGRSVRREGRQPPSDSV
jgi:hypothetical protein